MARSSSLFEAGFGRVNAALMEAHDVMMQVDSATGNVQEIYSNPSYAGLIGACLTQTFPTLLDASPVRRISRQWQSSGRAGRTGGERLYACARPPCGPVKRH